MGKLRFWKFNNLLKVTELIKVGARFLSQVCGTPKLNLYGLVWKKCLDIKFFSYKCGTEQHGETIAIMMESEAERMPWGKSMSNKAMENQKQVANLSKQRKVNMK